jgi:hypothetical protein
MQADSALTARWSSISISFEKRCVTIIPKRIGRNTLFRQMRQVGCTTSSALILASVERLVLMEKAGR